MNKIYVTGIYLKKTFWQRLKALFRVHPEEFYFEIFLRSWEIPGHDMTLIEVHNIKGLAEVVATFQP